jgi:hypothetical protein
MKISLLHPSRGRPEKSFKNAMSWIYSAGCDFQLIVSIDSSDPYKDEYLSLYHGVIRQENAIFNDEVFVLTINDNNSVVEATNRAAMIADGEILVYLSDDFKCPDNWGQLILKEFENENRPLLIKVDDCLQKFDVAVLTIPIMSRSLYERLGYFWHPSYKSMFVDEDLYWTTQKIGALKYCKHLKFPHEHPANGKASDDETYRRSALNWNQGKAMFAHRKMQGFPV